MFPVLFSIGSFSVSSFGVFLGLGFLMGVFFIWRLSRAWDLDEEKILDLTLITFLGGLIGARIYFIAENWQFFSDAPMRILLMTKYPGFSFWGGFLGGWLTLAYFARKFKIDFWQIADIASIGFLTGIIFANVGCFLGGCNVGVVSNFLSASMVGVVGKRFPLQLLEALLFSVVLSKLWSKTTHFHQRGKIVGLSLIFLGLIKIITEPLRASHSSFIFSAVILSLGLSIFYKVMKRSFITDLKFFAKFTKDLFTDPATRRVVIHNLGKSWYNQKVTVSWKFRDLTKILLLTLRRVNVKFSHKNSRFN